MKKHLIGFCKNYLLFFSTYKTRGEKIALILAEVYMLAMLILYIVYFGGIYGYLASSLSLVIVFSTIAAFFWLLDKLTPIRQKRWEKKNSNSAKSS